MNTTLESVKVLIERRKNLIDELNRTNSQLVIGYEKCILEIVAGRLTATQLSEILVPVVPVKIPMRPPQTPLTPLTPSAHPPISEKPVNYMSPSEMNMCEELPEEPQSQEPTQQEKQEKQENDEIVKEHNLDNPDTPETPEIREVPKNIETPKESQGHQETPIARSVKSAHPPNCPCEENNIAPPKEIHIPLSTKEIEESEKYQRAKAQQDKNISDWIASFNSKSDTDKKAFRDKYLYVLKQKLQEIIPLPNKDGAMQIEDDVKLVVQRKLNIEYYTRLLKVLQDYSMTETKRTHSARNLSEVENID